jgi:hypothetical protein
LQVPENIRRNDENSYLEERGKEGIDTQIDEYEEIEVEKPLRKGARIKIFMDLVSEMQEGELKILMFNYLAKVRTDNEEALQMMMHGISLEFFTLYHDGEGFLTKRQIMMKLIFDDNLYFKSRIKRSTVGLREKIKRKVIARKLREVVPRSIDHQ